MNFTFSLVYESSLGFIFSTASSVTQRQLFPTPPSTIIFLCFPYHSTITTWTIYTMLPAASYFHYLWHFHYFKFQPSSLLLLPLLLVIPIVFVQPPPLALIFLTSIIIHDEIGRKKELSWHHLPHKLSRVIIHSDSLKWDIWPQCWKFHRPFWLNCKISFSPWAENSTEPWIFTS